MNDYEKAAARIRDERRTELDSGYILLRDALERDDELHSAFVVYQAQMIAKAKGEKNDLAAARKKFDAQLKRLNLSRSVIYPKPHCKLCEDTGVVNGRYCKCVVREVISSTSDGFALPQTDFNEAKSTAPQSIKQAYAAAESFIAQYPEIKKPFFMLFGARGTGKTVLASAIASELMTRGAAVVTVTAFDFVRRALDYHTQFSIEKYVDRFTPMLDCDLLVIDDLGKEIMLKNVTLEYLYSVINERWLRKKPTVVTSNLEPSAALARYGESITSRLFDKNAATSFMIKGKNERL